MKVVLFHPTLLPPADYGGVERVVLWLAEGLVERGHQVSVAAYPGSRLPRGATLIPVEPAASAPEDFVSRFPAGTDVVHFHAPVPDAIASRFACASLSTVHGNGRPGEVFPRNAVFLTRNHAERHGGAVYVHNGIHPDEVRFGGRAEKGPRFLFLSKTSWKVKNLRGAIRYCARAGVPLTIAGGNRPVDLKLRATASALAGRAMGRVPRLEWAGPVAGSKKADLLATARALVFPVLWDEPFGLAVVEALMAGTPVLANRRGGLTELIDPTVGRIMSGDQDWVDFLSANEVDWDPEACRDWAMKRFHYRVMAENYEKLYRRVASGEVLHAVPPATQNQTP